MKKNSHLAVFKFLAHDSWLIHLKDQKNCFTIVEIGYFAEIKQMICMAGHRYIQMDIGLVLH